MILPDVQSLRCFEAVAANLSFRGAALKVGLCPAAFSDRIRKLEEGLGVQLLARSSRRVSLTPSGERLLPHVRMLLVELQRCAEVASGEPQAVCYDIRLGCRNQLAHTWLVPALPRLSRTDALRIIHVTSGDQADLIRKVRKGELDATIANAGFAEGPLESVPLHAEHYLLVGQAAWIREQGLKGPMDAPHHVLVDLDPTLPLSRYFLNAAGGSSRWHFRHLHFMGTLAAVRDRILQGGAVGVLPAYFAKRDLQAGRLARVLPRLGLQKDWIHFVWRKGHPDAHRLLALGKELGAIPLQ